MLLDEPSKSSKEVQDQAKIKVLKQMRDQFYASGLKKNQVMQLFTLAERELLEEAKFLEARQKQSKGFS